MSRRSWGARARLDRPHRFGGRPANVRVIGEAAQRLGRSPAASLGQSGDDVAAKVEVAGEKRTIGDLRSAKEVTPGAYLATSLTEAVAAVLMAVVKQTAKAAA